MPVDPSRGPPSDLCGMSISTTQPVIGGTHGASMDLVRDAAIGFVWPTFGACQPRIDVTTLVMSRKVVTKLSCFVTSAGIARKSTADSETRAQKTCETVVISAIDVSKPNPETEAWPSRFHRFAG